MYIVFITSLLAVLLTFLESKNIIRNGMFIGFGLVTLLGVIHYNYGSDYMAYYYLYEKIVNSHFNINVLFDKDFYNDFGWVLICWIFRNIGGFFMMVAVLNIIQNAIVYNFIKKNVNKEWWGLSVFCYLFITSLYLLNFSMMRQGFVVCVFLGTWTLIKKRKWLPALIIIYLCSFIHSSAIVLLPFAFYGYLPVKNGKVLAVLFLALFFILWMSSEFLGSVFNYLLVIEEFQNYAETYGGGDKVTKIGIGFLLNLIPFFLGLHYLIKSEDSDSNRRLVTLLLISYIIAPFTQIIQLIGRVSFYFDAYKLAALPLIYSNVKSKYRLIFIAIYLVIQLYSYWYFFNVGVFVKSYRVFYTIFDVL